MPTEKLLQLAAVLEKTAQDLRDIFGVWSEYVHPEDRTLMPRLYETCDQMEVAAKTIREGRYD